MEEIKINKNNQSLTFIDNGIGFSQFGVAREILDLIEKLQKEIEYLDDYNRSLHNENKRLNNIIEELDNWLVEQIIFIDELDKIPNIKEIEIEHRTMKIDYQNVRQKIKELKDSDK